VEPAFQNLLLDVVHELVEGNLLPRGIINVNDKRGRRGEEGREIVTIHHSLVFYIEAPVAPLF
jgi:hypothetical protein